jgi:hypothetical protein
MKWRIKMPTREQIDALAEAIDEPLLLMDGFDNAFIGTSSRINEPTLAVYSWELMVGVLIERDGMDYEDAVEYISYNCMNAWVGERTPIIVIPVDEF